MPYRQWVIKLTESLHLTVRACPFHLHHLERPVVKTSGRIRNDKRRTVPQSILAASAHFGVGDYRYREFPARSAFQIHAALSRSGLRLVEVEYRLAERFVIPAEPAAPTLVIERNRTALLQPLRQRPEMISVFK